MMKFNWGTGNFIFIVVFFIVIFSFIYYTTTQQINLVEEDYYEKEIKFQEQIDRIHNARPYEDQFTVKQNGHGLRIELERQGFLQGVQRRLGQIAPVEAVDIADSGLKLGHIVGELMFFKPLAFRRVAKTDQGKTVLEGLLRQQLREDKTLLL